MATTPPPGRIELKLRRVAQLFHTFDPSPFRDSDLAREAEDYIVGWAEDFPAATPIEIVIHVPPDEYTRAREDMLAATHKAHAPWTLVDFNDQRRGRLTLIRDLLDRLPDVPVAVDKPDLPALRGKLHRERYETVAPLPGYAPPKGKRLDD